MKSKEMAFNIESYLNSLPEDIEEIDVSHKKLKYIPDLSKFKNLKMLICSNNCLNSLPSLNEKLEGLYCYVNKLYSLPYLNEKLISFNFDNNPICEIINSRKNMNETKEKIKIFNKFRYLYYCLKFKKQFRDLLWKKVREPKIMRRYHPSYLIENLDVDIDLEMVVNSW